MCLQLKKPKSVLRVEMMNNLPVYPGRWMPNTHILTLVSVSKTHQLYNDAWAFLNELTII